jgi:hypothetical protein
VPSWSLISLSIGIVSQSITGIESVNIYYWQYFEHMLKQAHDENNNIICLGDMNKNVLGNLPHNIM